MLRRPPRLTPTSTPFPVTTLFRSLRIGEMPEQQVGVGLLEIVGREFAFGLPEHVAIRQAVAVVVQVVDVLDALDVHRQPFEPVGDLAGHRIAVETADLRSEEHTSELQSLMRNSYAVFCLKKK